MPYVGSSIRRSEDSRFIRGAGKFVADIRRAGMLHAAILRSPHAHARLLQVDGEPARRMPGVVDVLTFAGIAGTPPIPMRSTQLEGLARALQYPLAGDKVRYSGEPVAVVVATTRHQAEDALEAIDVRYEPLDAVVDPRLAIAPGVPALHDAVPDNVAGRVVLGVGDVDRAIAGADVVFEVDLAVQRHAAVPLETRGLVAEYDEGSGVLTVWGPAKLVHTNRRILAELLRLPESRIHFVEPDVGGGFGARGEFYPEDFLIPFLALRLRRPVCWIEDRGENLRAMNHSREQWHHLTVAVTRDGRIVAVEDRFLTNMGAYVRTHGGVTALGAYSYLAGPYDIQHRRAEISCVLTNKTPIGTYRGPGRFEAAFVRERLLDLIAHRLGLDPADVRLRNFIQPAQMPYDTGKNAYAHIRYDSGDYPRQLRETLAQVGYQQLKAERDAARRAGRAVGIGLGCFVEKSGLGPWEYARVEVDPGGQVTLFTGCASVGQGLETVLGQIVADEVGVDLRDVRVVHGDTDRVPYGHGGWASRATVVGGSAALGAARKAKAKLLTLAAAALEADPEDLVIDGGRIAVRGAPTRALALSEVARLAAPGPALAKGIEPGIAEEDFFVAEQMVYPYGVHVALVEVDLETGAVAVRRYVVAYDVGRAINPMLVAGQIVGGLGQGFGGAFLEELAYDAGGQLIAASFMDYLLPSAAEVPPVEVILTEDAPSPRNPLGIKGAGEGGLIGAGAALANAVSDALGVEVTRLPLTPEYVRELAHQAAPALVTH